MKKLVVLTLCLALLIQACNPVTGLPVEKALPNDVTTTYGYDDLNRLTNITQQKGGTLLGAYAYTLDDAGNRKSVTELGGSSIQWSYDNLYRLTSETRKNGNTIVTQSSFTYDLAGNRLTQTVNNVTTNYAYNELDQLLTAGSTQYQYDGRGNLAQEINGSQITQYQYDAADRLTNVALPDNTNLTYAYDADGRRVKQVTGSQVTSYLWDETSLYGDVVLETTSGVNTSYVLAGSKLISQTQSGTTSFYLQDGQGSTRNLTDSTGNVTDSYSYTAFGEIYNQTGTTENKYLYTGQQYDAETNLYSLRARFYNPAVGRFLSQDTYSVNFNNPIELNRYGYAANRAVNASDPSGHVMVEEVGTRSWPWQRAVIGALMVGAAVALIYYVGNVMGAVVRLIHVQPQTQPQTKPITWPDILAAPVRPSQFDPEPEVTVIPPPFPVPSLEPWTPPAPTEVPTEEPTEDTSHKHISLGLNEGERPDRRSLLPIFTYNLNQKLNPQNIFVYQYADWRDQNLANTFEPFEKRFTEAASNAEHIHFNLEGIRGDPVEFAEKLGPTGFASGNNTAAELYYIRHFGLCMKTSFYSQGSISVAVESVSLKTKICKLP